MVGDVVVLEREPLVTQQVRNVVHAPGQQVVEAQHLASLGQEPLAEMRAEETGAPCDQYALERTSTHVASPASGPDDDSVAIGDAGDRR